MYKHYSEDAAEETKAVQKEKEGILQEYLRLKEFLPLYKEMDKVDGVIAKKRQLVSMKEGLGKEEFMKYLYESALISINNSEKQTEENRDLRKKWQESMNAE